MKANWLSLVVAVIGLAILIAWIVAIAPPHIFTQPKFYVMVAGEIVLVWAYSWLVNRRSRKTS